MPILAILETIKKALFFTLSLWWIYVPIFLLGVFKTRWLLYVNGKYVSSLKWVLFEVQIPREETFGPKAMEQIFAGLSGTGSKGNLLAKYIQGKVPDWFSFEIVGIDGEVHFFIRAVARQKNLLESLIYAQYPTAIIQEVEDYAARIPKDAPNSSFDVYGSDFILAGANHLPIRTYPLFQDIYSKDMVDPLNSFMEILTKLQHGELLGMQILIRASDGSWKKDADKEVAKIIGKKVAPTPKTGFDDVKSRVLFEFSDMKRMFFEGLISGETAPKDYPEDKKPEGVGESMVQYLSPGEKEAVGAIEMKTSKIGFESAMRIFYFSRQDTKNVMNFFAVAGALKQFTIQNLNGFKPDADTITNVDYIFKNFRILYRKRLLLNKYILRDIFRTVFILNTEELATLYHFPGILAKAPMLSRVEAKRAEPPMSLPI
ncbi:MAG: hypothetical protein V1698_03020 [bacterium]